MNRTEVRDAMIKIAVQYEYDNGGTLDAALQKAGETIAKGNKRIQQQVAWGKKTADKAMYDQARADYEKYLADRANFTKKALLNINKLETDGVKQVSELHTGLRKNIGKEYKARGVTARKALNNIQKIEVEGVRKVSNLQTGLQTNIGKAYTKRKTKVSKVLSSIEKLEIAGVRKVNSLQTGLASTVGEAYKTREKIIYKSLANIKRMEINHKREVSNLQTGVRSTIGSNPTTKSSESLLGKFGRVGSFLGVASAIGLVVSAIKEAVSYALEYESAMADLQAKTGFTELQMGRLEESILDVARATQFSTIEIAGAATELGKLGFSAREVEESLLGVANTAAATNESLSTTAQTIGKVIRAFDYSARSAGLVSDQLVKSFNNSALNMEKFGTAFSYVGAIAADTGTQFEEILAAMQLLSDRGITASKMGTGLRKIMLKMGESGQSLTDILGDLSTGMVSIQSLSESIGQIGSNQLSILLNNYGEYLSMVEEAEKVNDEAAKAAAKQTLTTSNQLKVFWNNLKALIPKMKEYSGSTLTMKDAAEKNITMMEASNAVFDDGASIVERYLSSYSEVIPAYIAKREELKALNDEQPTHEEILASMGLVPEASAIQSLKDWFAEVKTTRMFLIENEKSFNAKIAIINEKEVEAGRNKFQSDLKRRVLGSSAKDSNILVSAILGYQSEGQFREAIKSLNLPETIIEQYNREVSRLDLGNIDSPLSEWLTYGGDRSKVLEMYRDETTKIADNWETILKKISKDTADESIFKNSKVALDNIFDLNKELETSQWIVADKESVQREIKQARETVELICKEGYAPLIEKYNIVCKKTKTRSKKEKPKIEFFQGLLEEEGKYLRKREQLLADFKDSEDPEEQSRIQMELLENEHNYRSKLLVIGRSYIENAKELEADFARRKPEEQNIYTPYRVGAEKQVEKSMTATVKNQIKYQDLKLRAYKEDILSLSSYKLEISNIEEEYSKKEMTPELVVEKQNKILAANKTYYEQALTDAEIYYNKLELATMEDEYISPEERLALVNSEAAINKVKAAYAKANAAAIKKSEKEEQAAKVVRIIGYAVQAAQEVADVIQMFSDAKLKKLEDEADKELAIIQKRYDSEKTIREGALEAGIISQEAATRAEFAANKAKVDAENKIAKKLFEERKKAEIQSIHINGIIQAAQAFAMGVAQFSLPWGAIVGAAGAALVNGKAIYAASQKKKEKFIPKATFAEGGIVEGRSHAQGGVPFTVQGRGGYEMEGGEYIVSKEATKRNFAQLEELNGKTKKRQSYFAAGGVVAATAESRNNSYIMDEMLKALKQPVRAFITNQDLEKSESERNALTLKTKY